MNAWLGELANDATDPKETGSVERRGPWIPPAEGGACAGCRQLSVWAVSAKEGLVELALDTVECPVEVFLFPARFSKQLDKHSGWADVECLTFVVR